MCEKADQGLDRRQHWPAGVLPSHRPPDHLKESTQRDRISHPDTDEGGAVESGPEVRTSSTGPGKPPLRVKEQRGLAPRSLSPAGLTRPLPLPTHSVAMKMCLLGLKDRSHTIHSLNRPLRWVAVPVSREFTVASTKPQPRGFPRGTRAHGSSCFCLGCSSGHMHGHVKSRGSVVCPAPAWCATCLPGFLADLPGRRRALDQKPAGAGADALERHS